MHANKNVWIVYCTGFLRGLVFFLPIFALYVQQELFTVLNVTLILSVGSITAIIFETPSGAFADLFGRKNTLLLAGLLLLLAVGFLSVGGSLLVFIAYAVVNGIAESLFSGTDTALLYDTLLQTGQEKRFKKVVAVSNTMWPLGAALSSFLGGFLASVTLQLPIYVTVIPFALAFVLTFFLTEPSYEKETHGMIKQLVGGMHTIIGNRQILLLSLAGFLFYAFGEVLHQLKPLFFEYKGIPLEAFGVIFALTFGLSAIGSYISHTITEAIGDKNTLVWSGILPAVLLIGAVLTSGLWAGILLVFGSIFWGIRWPIVTHLLHMETHSKQRATVISFGNLANKLGLAIFAPLFGYAADIYTINTAYALAIVPSFIVVGVLFLVREPQRS